MSYRKLGLGLAAFAAGAAAWIIGVSKLAPRSTGAAKRAGDTGSAEHVPTDLLGDRRPAPGDRAPAAFRPDPTAIPTAEEREALRPATGPAPTLAADRGTGFA